MMANTKIFKNSSWHVHLALCEIILRKQMGNNNFLTKISNRTEIEKVYLYVLQTLSYKISSNSFNINIEALNNRFDPVCIFDSNQNVNDKKNIRHNKIIAIGSTQELVIKNETNAFEKLQQFYDSKKGWIFGYLTYDIKNEIEELSSKNKDRLGFPALHFFSPQVVLQIDDDLTTVFYDDDFISKNEVGKIYDAISRINSPLEKPVLSEPVVSGIEPSKEGLGGLKDESKQINIQSKITKKEYLDVVNKLKQHIRLGDIYEINFCQEFFAENAEINTVALYEKLNDISQAPFATYYKFKNNYLLCSSPERFLQKTGNMLISQPIKGTAKRSEDKLEDERFKSELQNNPKEQSENVMIVDLVRNDLSRIA